MTSGHGQPDPQRAEVVNPDRIIQLAPGEPFTLRHLSA
jgi:hypothetical protein